jgi:hypothetical protein
MLKRFVLLISLMALMFLSTNAGAAQYTFDFSGSGISGSGILDTTIDYPTYSLVTSGSVLVNGVDNYNLVQNKDQIYQATSPLGAFYFNNFLYDTEPYLDINGLVFSDGSREINFYNQSGYFAFTSAGNPNYFGGSLDEFKLTPTPIPAAILLLGPGLVGLAGIRRRMAR